MLFKDVIGVYTDNHMAYTNTLSGQNEGLLVIKAVGAYKYRSDLNGLKKCVAFSLFSTLPNIRVWWEMYFPGYSTKMKENTQM
jgi:hypothetical protein